MSLAADAVRVGMDPHLILDNGKEDFLVNLAILRKATINYGEEKRNELEAQSKLIASELAQILGKIYG